MTRRRRLRADTCGEGMMSHSDRRQKTGDDREVNWLAVRGFDGLYHPDPVMECGCFLGDLRPCGDLDTPCRGGRASVDEAGVFSPARFRGVTR